jgi:hypothetical protein
MLDDSALRLAEFPGPRERARRTWVNIWPAIRDDVIETVRLASGQQYVGVWNHDGPLACFLAQLIPIITGERPKPSTIANKISGGRTPV